MEQVSWSIHEGVGLWKFPASDVYYQICATKDLDSWEYEGR